MENDDAMAVEHNPVITIHGARDKTPFLLIKTNCTCGVEICTRTYDARNGRPAILHAAEAADSDVQLFLRHRRAMREAERN